MPEETEPSGTGTGSPMAEPAAPLQGADADRPGSAGAGAPPDHAGHSGWASSRPSRRTAAFAAEFVTIVVGVLVALAADSALERGRERGAARRALEFLRADVEHDIRQLDSYWTSRLALQEEARVRLRDFLINDEPIRDSVQFVRDVREVASYTTLDPSTAAVEGLIASGRLDLVQDANLRARILDYLNDIENIAEFDALHRAQFLDLYASLATRVVGGLALPSGYGADILGQSAEVARSDAATALDAEAIRDDDALRRLLAATGQPFMIKADRYRALRADADSLISLLSAALGG